MADNDTTTTTTDPGVFSTLLPRDAHWEERILYFLKEMPAWLIILGLLGFLVTIWLRTGSEQIESYIGQALAALLTAVVTNRNRGAQNNTSNSTVVKTDTVEAENVETATTERGDINATNVTTATSKPGEVKLGE